MVWPIWLVYAVLTVASAVIQAYLAPSTSSNATASEGNTPEANEGTIIRKVYGTVWVTDSQVLAWKYVTPEPIKKKGGKK